jgi:TPR repeat protein
MQAAQGGREGLAVAQANAGRCWRDGIGGRRDLETALSYYEDAAFTSTLPRRTAWEGAAWHCAELYLAKALAASRSGNDQEQRRFLHQARGLLKQALNEGFEGASLALAGSYLGVYGGEINADKARPHLARAERSPDLAAQARAMRDQHGL